MAHIRTRTLNDGARRYDVEWRSASGRVVTETFPTRKLADARLHTIEVDKLRGVAIDPRRGRVTFTE